VVVCFKIASCSLKAVKGTQYKLEQAYKGFFMIDLGIIKGQFYDIMYSFLTGYGGSLYGTVRSRGL
jgi:hypothetical protein